MTQKINNVEQSASICLTVICKNEANVIERMLNTVVPIIDAYVVVDTGSTDGTQEIVKKFFEEKGIPGRVVEHPWKNFGDARNKAITEAESLVTELNLPNPMGFWVDCDEQMIYDKNFEVWLFKRKLADFDAANAKVIYGAQRYHRMQFYKLNDGWHFEGPLHEVLINDRDDIKSATIDGFNVLVTADGNSWTSQTIKEKYEGHAKILEDYVANDPKKDARWLFYLAQSYRDCENVDKAIEWYTKRAENLTGYWEEIYYSRYMIASLKAKRNDNIYEVMEAYRRCGQTNMHRVEHLLPLILYYQSIKDYDTAYIYSSHAMRYAGKSPSPKANLFIDVPFYLWKIYDLHCISSWYSGRRDESTQTYKKLWKMVEKGLVEEPDLTRIKDNKKFFLNLKK
jgi:glycosyltransferase involved in cell wall biosynthesis